MDEGGCVYLKSLRRSILIIPAYNPPFYFVDYVKDLVENGFEYILVPADRLAPGCIHIEKG